MVNPAILGDEYLYSINARKAAPWDPSPAGDFSNYLFNLVYSSTNLCGDAFYACGKLLNLVFFVGFLTVIFIVAKRYMNYWIAFAFTVLAGLSPLSVYTSMFLPETMYFFFLGLVFASVLKAADTYAWKDWAVVGSLIGVTSLVKPHAWLSAIAIGIFLVVLGLTKAKYRFGPLLRAIGAISAGAILARVIIGFLVAGPKALGFFGQYLNAGVVEQIAVTAPSGGTSTASAVATTPMNGVFSLFGTQLNIHMLTISALMGVAILGVTVGVIELVKTRELTKVTALTLFSFIWLFSLVIEVVVFTGWITGGGDDHTTRVLERYYDFLFVIVPLAGLAALTSKFMSESKIWVRAPLAVFMLILITPAFSGFFGTLTIQIADAPNLAGLVVNQDVFNAAALFGFASLIVFAFFPKYTPLVLIGLLPVTMVGTGYQIQDQYQGFRGELNAQDKAGQYLRANLTQEQIDSTWIAATSRFEATNVAIWADSAKIKYDLFGAGSALDATLVPEGSQFVLVTGDVTYTGPVLESIPGEGYTLHRIK
jgi:phosphoglycerol transferase